MNEQKMKMRYKIHAVYITALITMITACSGDRKTEADKSMPHTDTVSHGYNELANPDKRETFSISDYNTDNDAVENIGRPSLSTIHTSMDTTLLFDAWTINPDGPHADFDLSAQSFYVVDYDGDGDMPYELNDQHIKIYYNDFIQEGDIIAVSADSLKIRWADHAEITAFVRWRQ